MRITVRVFFRSVHVSGAENIPPKAPILLLSNHPNTFMDPIVIAVFLQRRVHFLAAGKWFNLPLGKWLFPKFNMIPVYRKVDDPTQMKRNEETFDTCFEHLEKNGMILIFPEGISTTERRIKHLKSGSARIALGAEARNDYKLGVKVVTVGLNYSAPDSFRSELHIKIDPPIDAAKYANSHKADAFKAVHELTNEVRDNLQKQVIAIDDEHVDVLVKNIEDIYKGRIAKELGISRRDKEEVFNLTKTMIEVVNHYTEKDPQRVKAVKKKIDDYMEELDRLGLNDGVVGGSGKKKSLFLANVLNVFYVILGLPLYLYGLINNFIPYRIPGFIAKKYVERIEFRGPIMMVAGIFSFSIFYTAQIWLAAVFLPNAWWALGYALSLPLSGAFTYYYWNRLNRIRARWLFVSLFYRRTELVSNLVLKRQEIINDLDKAREEYNSTVVAQQ